MSEAISGEADPAFRLAHAGYSRLRIRVAGPSGGLPPRAIRLLPVAAPVRARADAIDGRGSGHSRRCSGIKDHRRFSAPPDLVKGGAQNAAIGGDRLIRLTQVLPGAILDDAHGFARPLIVDVDVGAHAGERRVLLLVRIEPVVVALILARDVIGKLVELEP